jgi:hypothetical protein
MDSRWILKRRDLWEWSWRAAICILLSAWGLAKVTDADYWAPGVAFSLLIIPARRGFKLPLLVAVALAYSVAYAGMASLGDNANPWVLRIAVVSLGSFLLGQSLRSWGSFSKKQALEQWLLGTVLAVPFWQAILGGADGAPSLQKWILAFAVWQGPMSYLYFAQTKKGA